ncbi:hypothetical protein GTA09_20000 [Rhodococcus hoagii]|nr:hypothetical protein [Prescottella equi]
MAPEPPQQDREADTTQVCLGLATTGGKPQEVDNVAVGVCASSHGRQIHQDERNLKWTPSLRIGRRTARPVLCSSLLQHRLVHQLKRAAHQWVCGVVKDLDAGTDTFGTLLREVDVRECLLAMRFGDGLRVTVSSRNPPFVRCRKFEQLRAVSAGRQLLHVEVVRPEFIVGITSGGACEPHVLERNEGRGQLVDPLGRTVPHHGTTVTDRQCRFVAVQEVRRACVRIFTQTLPGSPAVNELPRSRPNRDARPEPTLRVSLARLARLRGVHKRHGDPNHSIDRSTDNPDQPEGFITNLFANSSWRTGVDVQIRVGCDVHRMPTPILFPIPPRRHPDGHNRSFQIVHGERQPER